MHLRKIVIEKLLVSEIVPALVQEWADMHHNATIQWPDVEESDWELFWNCLSDYSRMRLDDLQEEIKSECDLDLKLYQYGRSGATVAPDEFIRNTNSYYKTSFDPDYEIEENFGLDTDCDLDECDWEYAFEYSKNLLKAFKLINTTIRADAKYIPEWWKEEKKCLAEAA